MRFVSIRELRVRPRPVWSLLRREKIWYATNGKPVGVLTAADEERLESILASLRQGRAQAAVADLGAMPCVADCRCPRRPGRGDRRRSLPAAVGELSTPVLAEPRRPRAPPGNEASRRVRPPSLRFFVSVTGSRRCGFGTLPRTAAARTASLDVPTSPCAAIRSRLRSRRPTSGKQSNSHGLRTTTFEPAASRAAYLPRVKPAGKSERLYDRRRSSLAGGLAFFIKPTFWACRRPGADDTNGVALVGVGNGEQPRTVRHSERDPSGLVDRMIGVGTRDGKRISQHAARLLEGYLVLPAHSQ